MILLQVEHILSNRPSTQTTVSSHPIFARTVRNSYELSPLLLPGSCHNWVQAEAVAPYLTSRLRYIATANTFHQGCDQNEARIHQTLGTFSRYVGGRGLQHPATATAVMIEELAYHSNSVAAIVDVHCILAGRALEHASPALQERYLAPLLAGEKIGSFATIEPEASTDLSVRMVWPMDGAFDV